MEYLSFVLPSLVKLLWFKKKEILIPHSHFCHLFRNVKNKYTVSIEKNNKLINLSKMFVSINVEMWKIIQRIFQIILSVKNYMKVKKTFGYVESESIVFNTYYDKRTHTSA